MVQGSMPWQTDSTKGDEAREHFKYQYGYIVDSSGLGSADVLNRYHPGGDPRNPPRDAPSALHSVIVPNVNLPKVRVQCCSCSGTIGRITELDAS